MANKRPEAFCCWAAMPDRIFLAAKEGIMEQPAAFIMSRFVHHDDRPFRAIGWGMLMSLPAWVGLALLFI